MGGTMMKKICLLTGASSAIAQRLIPLLLRDYTVIAGYSKKIKKSISGEVPIILDLTSNISTNRVVSGIIHKYKKIDLLINLAGISPSGRFDSFSIQDFQTTMDINVIGPFRLIKAVLPSMRRQKHGRIINIASLSAIAAFPNFSIYSASKFALRGLSLSLSQELISENIFVTCVCPGAIQKDNIIASNSARTRLPILRYILPLTTIGTFTHRLMHEIHSPRQTPELIIGVDAWVSSFLSRLFPYLWYKIQQFVWQRQK